MPYPDLISDIQMTEIRRRVWEGDGRFVTTNPVGESVFDRADVENASASTTQLMKLVGFTARVTQNITRIRVVTAGTAAGATPTLCRLGVYARDSSNNFNQVAAVANDTSLFSAANTTYTPSFTTSFIKTAGTDYLVALLIVSAAAFPTFVSPIAVGQSVAGYSTDVLGAFPILAGQIAAQADLPASFAAASVASSTASFHALLLQ